MHSKQVLRQYHTPEITGRRVINDIPFAEELPAERAAELDAWLPWASVSLLRQRLQSGELTSRMLALYFLGRIRRAAALNAVGELNPDVLDLANQLDDERRNGALRGPLHGIPVLLKDNVSTGDRMHTTAGAKVLEHFRAGADAFVAQKLRAAGALILGKTNLSEWANFMTSTSANGFSVLGGQVRNPYGKHDVSGSSSGSAAAVAAGLVPLAVGTETCGSLIAPGAANSIAVLKPTLGLISRRGIIPITGVTDTAGPMARSAADLAPLLQALAGPDPDDPVTLQPRAAQAADWVSFLDAGALRGLRLGFVTPRKPPPAEWELIERCARVLRACGAEVVHLSTHQAVPWHEVVQVFCYGMQHDLAGYFQSVPGPAPVSSLAEIIAFNQADLTNRAPFGQNLLERSQALSLSPAEHAGLVEKIRAMTGAELRRLRAEPVDLLVSLGNSLSGYYAIAGFPALTVPAGYRKAGRPFGLTFVGEPYEDGRLIAAAYAFEQAAQARVAPPDSFKNPP